MRLKFRLKPKFNLSSSLRLLVSVFAQSEASSAESAAIPPQCLILAKLSSLAELDSYYARLNNCAVGGIG